MKIQCCHCVHLAHLDYLNGYKYHWLIGCNRLLNPPSTYCNWLLPGSFNGICDASPLITALPLTWISILPLGPDCSCCFQSLHRL
ncbi:hypothetical protein BGS_0128 [Beggiatoa sp. SS]|nr:hypothetical protein BGS_0128 [Beggiatoa sp. SS]